jgi:hypothetical protein
MRGDRGPGGQPGKRPEQGGPRVGPVPVTDGNRPRPAQRPEHQNAPDGHGRPVNRPAPNQGAKPMGTGPHPQVSPAQQTGPQKSAPSPHPKPHPTPSPRPRANQPAQGNAGAPSGAAQGTREAAGARGPVDQHARNGVINRENGAPPSRGDDDGRPTFGSGAR